MHTKIGETNRFQLLYIFLELSDICIILFISKRDKTTLAFLCYLLINKYLSN